jgi:adenylate kinase family enzyme
VKGLQGDNMSEDSRDICSSAAQSCCQRIIIVGTPGAGKTALAHQLHQSFQYQPIELGKLWDAAQQFASPVQVFQQLVGQALKGDRWALDDYTRDVHDEIWSRIDTIVFLDYSFHVLIEQTQPLTQNLPTPQPSHNNSDSGENNIFKAESDKLNMLRQHHRNHKKYLRLLQQAETDKLSIVHLQSPSMTEAWLASIQVQSPVSGSACGSKQANPGSKPETNCQTGYYLDVKSFQSCKHLAQPFSPSFHHIKTKELR